MTRTKIVETRRDTTGTIIKEHDVLRDDETGEMAIVVHGRNRSGVSGLGVENPLIGINEWLDIYPDGVWTIVGNFAVSIEE